MNRRWRDTLVTFALEMFAIYLAFQLIRPYVGVIILLAFVVLIIRLAINYWRNW